MRRADDGRIGEARGADQQVGDERGALLVESRGRLVEQHDVGPPGERTRDRDALALARREAIGRALDAVGQAEALEPGARLGLVLRRAAAVLDLRREQHVLERSGERDEARLLTDPADVIAAVRCQLLAVELAEIGAGDDQRARVRALEARDEVQQRRLARAGAPLDGDQPAAREGGLEARQHGVWHGRRCRSPCRPRAARTRPRRRPVPRRRRASIASRASPSPESATSPVVRPPARAPADAGLVAGALGQAHPAAAADDEPVGAAPHQLAADAPVAHVHDAVGELGGGLVVAHDHERRPAAGDHLPEQAVDACARCARRARPRARRPGAAQGRGRARRRPRRAAARRPRAPRAGRRRGLPGPCRRAAPERAPAVRCTETPPSARGSATLSAQESAGERARA